MKTLTPKDLADLFWSAANEHLSHTSTQHEDEERSGYSCTAIELAARDRGYKFNPYWLLEPARQSCYVMVRDLITDADGRHIGDLCAADCTPEQIEAIQGQRYLWLMFCHQAAKNGLFHMRMDGHPREVLVEPFDEAD
jgi:hypothetical protein